MILYSLVNFIITFFFNFIDVMFFFFVFNKCHVSLAFRNLFIITITVGECRKDSKDVNDIAYIFGNEINLYLN